MKIEIIKVVKGEFETVYIKAKPVEAGIYRRFKEGGWEHWQGQRWGWHEYPYNDLLEAAYTEWVRKERNANPETSYK